MKKQDVLNALKKVREQSKQRKFVQTAEYILNFKGIDFKKADKRIDVDVILPHATGKQTDAKVLVFVKTKSFADELKDKADVLMEEDIPKLNKKKISELTNNYDALFAEGSTMLLVGKHLGQHLAPKGKMPKLLAPKIAVFNDLIANLNVGIKITNKKGKFMPLIQAAVGNEKMTDDHLAENVMAVYESVVDSLEKRTQGIKSSYIKFTMSAPVQIEGEK